MAMNFMEAMQYLICNPSIELTAETQEYVRFNARSKSLEVYAHSHDEVWVESEPYGEGFADRRCVEPVYSWRPATEEELHELVDDKFDIPPSAAEWGQSIGLRHLRALCSNNFSQNIT